MHTLPPPPPPKEPNLDRMAERVQNLFEFKQFYNQVDFSMEDRFSITKCIFELTDPSESYKLIKKR